MLLRTVIALVWTTANGKRFEIDQADSHGLLEAALESTPVWHGDVKKAGPEKYCIDTIPTKWKKKHFGQCKMHLFHVFGTFFQITGRTWGTDVPIDGMVRGVGKSSLLEVDADGAATNNFTVIVSATSRYPVSPNLTDTANEVIFVFPLYKKKDTAFTILQSPMQIWRLVKWAVAGYKVIFRRVDTREAAINALALTTSGKVRHVVIGGHGHALHRTILISDNEYFSTSKHLWRETDESRIKENRLIYGETKVFFQAATFILGTLKSTPETSIFIESCETAHEVRLESTGEVVSMFDDIVGIITEAAQRGQKIKVVGIRESFNSNQIAEVLKAVKGINRKGHLWEVRVSVDWHWLLFSGTKQVAVERIVEP